MEKIKNEVTKKESNDLAIFQRSASSPKHEIDKSDLVFPRILLCQGNSELIRAKKARPGEIIDTLTYEVLGEVGKEFNIIPLVMYKTYGRYEKLSARDELIERKNWVESEHGKMPFLEASPDGKTYKNQKEYNFYVMLERDLEIPGRFPYLVRFKGGSGFAGKKLASHFNQTQVAGVEAWIGTWAIAGIDKTAENDANYIALDTRPIGTTKKEYAVALRKWSEMLADVKFQNKEADVDEVAAAKDATPTPNSTAQF